MKNEIVYKECILYNLPVQDKKKIIEQLVHSLKKADKIYDQQLFLQAVFKRENMFPTSIGNMIAIPHGMSHQVKQPSLCIARLKDKVLWDQEKNEYVKIVILIAVPDHDDGHLHIKILSHLMRHLMHEEYINKLLKASEQELLDMLKEGLGEV